MAGILLQLGIDEQFLTGKHTACPLCEGTDRFRFDNQKGSGSYICNQCGAGYGFDLLMAVHGWTFATAAAEVDKVVGNCMPEAVASKADGDTTRRWMRELWEGAARYGVKILQDGILPVAMYCLEPFRPVCGFPPASNHRTVIAIPRC